MLVIDASVLFEVVADTAEAAVIGVRPLGDPDLHAPHLVDAEVLSVVQRHHRAGRLHTTAATQAVSDLRAWPGQRWAHRDLLGRA